MYWFCTLFDSNYLYKGLALYRSLSNVCNNFHLFILACDDNCDLILKSLNLENTTIISLSKFETKELLNVKEGRNNAEYYWTCGPSFIYYCLNQFNLDHCTYLDSDLMFFSSPKPLFDEIGKNSVAITEHFTKRTDKLGGRFCVQFVYFKNDGDGMKALTWWLDQCIEWCFARYENGKYGDQKYLDYFPEKFNNVHIIENRGCGVAPWNFKQYKFIDNQNFVFRNKKYKIIFFHFHGIRIDLISNKLILKTITYDLNKQVKDNIFMPYLQLIKDIYCTDLNIPIEDIYIEKRNSLAIAYSYIKRIFRNNKIAQLIYFKLFNIKYNGYEKNKIV